MAIERKASYTLFPAVHDKTAGGRWNHYAAISPRATCSLGMQARHSTAAQHGTAQHALMLMSSAMQQGNHYSFHVSSLGLVAQAFSDTRLPNP